jgi:hypothetical protein
VEQPELHSPGGCPTGHQCVSVTEKLEEEVGAFPAITECRFEYQTSFQCTMDRDDLIVVANTLLFIYCT